MVENGANESVRRGGVISLAARRAPGRFGALDDVRRYWEALRGDRLLPLRSEIDPRGIDGALDGAFIVERIAPGIARFRLAGTSLVDLMGAEVRGMPLSVLFDAGSRRVLADAVEAVFSGPEALRVNLTGERGMGRPPLEAEMLMLPLKSDLGDTTRALGCLVTGGGVGRTPRRLVVRTMERTDLMTGERRLDDGRAPGEPETAPRSAPAGARTDEAPGLRPVPGAPHLRVMQGGR